MITICAGTFGGVCNISPRCTGRCALLRSQAPYLHNQPGTNQVPGCTPIRSLSEADVRRIVREEIAASKGVGNG